MFLITFVLLLLSSLAADDLPRLPRVDRNGVTVSGISSGADFAAQFHVAYSETVRGVGIFAGQPWRCAATRFPEDELLPSCSSEANCSVPICDGCPSGKTLLYDHCKSKPGVVDPEALAASIRAAFEAGEIDDPANLRNHSVYIYRGTMDGTYATGAEERVIELYSRFVGDGGRADGGLIAYEGSVRSRHVQPTYDVGSPCLGPYDGPYSYLAACGYDGAGAVLRHLYGPDLLPRSARMNESFLLPFDQRPYFSHAGDPGLASEGYVFVPPQCLKENDALPRCKLHVWLHGCGGPDRFYEAAVRHAGFNEWAESNDIVVLYPAMRSWGTTTQTRAGCWDSYAQTGGDYAYKSGKQMLTVHAMISALMGS